MVSLAKSLEPDNMLAKVAAKFFRRAFLLVCMYFYIYLPSNLKSF